MARPSHGPRRSVHVRVPEDLYAELVLLRPELQDSQGSTKYGALNSYFLSLISQDLDGHKAALRKQLEPADASV
jgi:hypothetical protein